MSSTEGQLPEGRPVFLGISDGAGLAVALNVSQRRYWLSRKPLLLLSAVPTQAQRGQEAQREFVT
ncbi:MAG: hypothetical protein QQW96_23145 [Tychonema bourrellyi B0820]|nr:hypothetical protein [Tychonema bourrellyi B0820]